MPLLLQSKDPFPVYCQGAAMVIHQQMVSSWLSMTSVHVGLTQSHLVWACRVL